jgi:nucleoside triphosphate pyrophosphatase
MTEVPVVAPLILGSASPHRRRLLQAAGLAFDVVPAPIDEAAIKQVLAAEGRDGCGVASQLAAAKAQAVSASFPDAIVIGADQVLECEGRLFDKPGQLANARRQLQRLRGRAHHLHTAVALADQRGIVWQHCETASLLMRPFSDAFLEDYLSAAGETIWSTVGAYEIEGIGIQLFASVSGDASSIIGLPMLPLLTELRARGMIAT